MILPFRILSAYGKQNVNPVFSSVTDNCFIGRHLDSMLQKKNLKTERETWETFHHYSSSAVEYLYWSRMPFTETLKDHEMVLCLCRLLQNGT